MKSPLVYTGDLESPKKSPLNAKIACVNGPLKTRTNFFHNQSGKKGETSRDLLTLVFASFALGSRDCLCPMNCVLIDYFCFGFTTLKLMRTVPKTNQKLEISKWKSWSAQIYWFCWICAHKGTAINYFHVWMNFFRYLFQLMRKCDWLKKGCS